MDSTSPDAQATLRAAGLRATAPRLAVLAALVTPHSHPDADTISGVVRRALGTVSTQAVYNTLHALLAADVIRQIEPAGSSRRYELRRGDNHHHMVCRRCRAITDIDCVSGSAPCLDPVQAQGYSIDEAEITFWGICPTCQPHAAGR